MTKSISLKGKAVVIENSKGELIDDIDTDMIFHNKYLHITKIEEMGQYAFDNLEGWKDFAKKTKKNDILFLGTNFGAGSSRQQAVDCFTALGVQVLVAKSFGAIYKRNAINAGMPLIEINTLDFKDKIQSGDEVEINLETGLIKNLTKKVDLQATSMSKVQLDIYHAGNLFSYGKKI